MGIPTYTTGYPPDGSFLGETKAIIRDNLDGTFLTLGVDHINNNGAPGSNPAGYHNLIHLVPQNGVVAPVAGYGELYARVTNTFIPDTAMFWKTGTGIGIQMTMNIAPSANTNGYTFLPGGILMQWGESTAVTSASSTIINFNIPFPNAIFNVSFSVQTSDNTTIRCSILNDPTLSSFELTHTSSSHFTKVYWTAIGN